MEISPEYLLEGLMLKPKHRYFVHLMWRTDSLEKFLILGKIKSRRRRGQHGWNCMASPTWWTWVWATPVVGDGQGSLAWCSSWSHKELDMTEWLKWWTYQRILRYQVILVENPGLAISPCEVVNPILLQTPKGSLPFPSCLETLDHWKNH